jgi:predicted nucleic-acid-binding protein
MIALDTNILVRYLVQDEPIQSAKATALIEKALSETAPGFVSVVALAELAWVLERIYGFATTAVASAIERLLQLAVLHVENEQEVFTAMIALKEGRGSFADALIAALGAKAGCSHTLTFDKKALHLAGFQRA